MKDIKPMIWLKLFIYGTIFFVCGFIYYLTRGFF